ncbi:MAG: YigZ family protein [Methanobrevibacter sp.]|nr:YigZ family protein [Methanobrevibacter sp.]
MKTIAKSFQADLTIKKSQFICRIFNAENSIEAKKIIQEVKNEYYDATHNCSAYLTIDGEGYDDDGEPSGTAGKPILNILKKNDLKNIVAIVTRYFGGIKLGASGLVRAYSKSVLEVLAIAEIVEMKPYIIYKIIFEYQNIKFIDDEIRNYKIFILNKNFKEKVSYKIAIEKNRPITPFFEKLNLKIKTIKLEETYLYLDKITI